MKGEEGRDEPSRVSEVDADRARRLQVSVRVSGFVFFPSSQRSREAILARRNIQQILGNICAVVFLQLSPYWDPTLQQRDRRFHLRLSANSLHARTIYLVHAYLVNLRPPP